MWKCDHVPVIILVSFLLMDAAGIHCQETDVRQKNHVLSEISAETALFHDAFDNARSKIKHLMKETGVASIVVAVAKEGKIIWEEGFGWANKEKEIEAAPHIMYPIASITKSMTATALMILVERGLIELDKPANDYLGESKLVSYVDDPREATVGRLLYHTAGLPMHWNIFRKIGPVRRPGMEVSIKRYGFLVTAPGERYHYSNFGYGVLGYIISRVSGKSYAKFMKEEVFEPLGMTQTSVLTDSGMNAPVAQIYTMRGKPILPFEPGPSKQIILTFSIPYCLNSSKCCSEKSNEPIKPSSSTSKVRNIKSTFFKGFILKYSAAASTTATPVALSIAPSLSF